MTKKERIEQLEQDLADLRIEVDRLRIKSYDPVSTPNIPADPFFNPLGGSPNYFTCQSCYGRYPVGNLHICGWSYPNTTSTWGNGSWWG